MPKYRKQTRAPQDVDILAIQNLGNSRSIPKVVAEVQSMSLRNTEFENPGRRGRQRPAQA